METDEWDGLKIKKEVDLEAVNVLKANVNSFEVNFVVPDFARAQFSINATGFGEYFQHFNMTAEP